MALILAPLFQDHAVLQRDAPVPVWGRAAAGTPIMVAFKQQRVATWVDAAGRWMVRLANEPASADPAELTVTGETTITLRDILVGEVWLASGQSNMARPMSDAMNSASEIAAADYPLIRRFHVQNTVADQPTASVAGQWQVCTPAVAGTFSGVGYFFARDLFQRLGVPIGLIQSTWGGTPIEAWMSAGALESVSIWPAIKARWERNCAEYPARRLVYPEEQAAWAQADEQFKANRTRNPLPWPKVPAAPGTQDALSGLYNGMIAPLQPFALRGVIWWQGESNWTRADEYGELFRTMIQSWREDWQCKNLPFYFVQLANYLVGCDSSDRAWAIMREAQAQALVLPQTAMAVTIDLGDPYEIHLTNKQAAAHRLVQIAANRIYGRPATDSGPVFLSATCEGAAMRVRFMPDTIPLDPTRTPVQALELAGEDRVFNPAWGVVENNTVVVSSAEVPRPVAVRYAWSNAPEANLFNRADLPAAPFRSDSWPQQCSP